MIRLRDAWDHVHRKALAAALVAVVSWGWGTSAGAQVLPSVPAKSSCVVSDSEFATWFRGGIAGADKPVIPANSLTLDTSNNCNFYKWSEQMFLWMASTGSLYGGAERVFNSPVFYQVLPNEGSSDYSLKLVPQEPSGILNLAMRAAQAGPNGLPVIMDAKGKMRQFVTLPTMQGKAMMSTAQGAKTMAVAEIRRDVDGKALFVDGMGHAEKVALKVTADMLPKRLGRLAALVSSDKTAKMMTATSLRQKVADVLTAKNILIKVDTKTGPVFVEAGSGALDGISVGQAGGNGVLISQNYSVVYYQTLVNDVFAWYLTGRKTQTNGIAPYYGSGSAVDYGEFPTTREDLIDIMKFMNAQASGQMPIIGLLEPEALAMELKLSWVDAATLPNGTEGYITAQAVVPVFDRSSKTVWKATSQTKTITVALVGAHVVGSTAGHPEMIWATFEHKDNSPLASYQYISSAGDTVTEDQNTTGAWLFAPSGTNGPFNDERAAYQSDSSKEYYGDIVVAGSATQIGPTSVLRMKPWGVASTGQPNQEDGTPAVANTEVVSLNQDMQMHRQGIGAQKDPRFNYLFIGSTWTFGGGEPNGPYPSSDKHYPAVADGTNEIGTSMLMNSTMETFHQGGNSTATTGTTCFGCHNSNTSDPAKKATTYVSHIFGSVAPLSVQ